MKRSRLYDEHSKRGASFIEQGGWEVPAHYGNAAAEHLAVRRGVGIADLSQRGKIRVTGDDRTKWLQSVISNDILPLAQGQGTYSSLLTHKGKMLTYFRVYQLGEALMLEDVGEIGDVTYAALRKFLLFGTKAKMESLIESYGHLLISGPKAVDLLSAATGLEIGGLKPLEFLAHESDGRPALLIRTEETGEKDFELLIPAGSCLVEVWNRIWAAGEAIGLQAFGAHALESLRVEAGLPKAGPDLNENIVPPEANLEGKAFSLTKGCYPGQEVVARMDTYGSVRRRLVGLVLEGNSVPPPGSKLFSGDREVGWITSAVHSPSLAKVIAFGFPLRDFTPVGTPLTVEIHGERKPATVHALPFIKGS
ncbi:MAG: aminomethyl transferase family protein [Nitrospirae bacterium]|nr:MAG: aminomethyl transferase family protein [Nitrospirota bacterium]